MRILRYNRDFYLKYGYQVTIDPIDGGLENKEEYDAYEHSYALARNGDMAGVDIIKKYIDKYPNIPSFKNHLVTIYIVNNQHLEARRVQLQTLNQHPDYLYGKIIMIEDCLKNGELEMARRVLGEPRKIETISPNAEIYHHSEFLSYYYLAGWYEVEIGDSKAAQKHLELMVELDPNDQKTESLADKMIESTFEKSRNNYLQKQAIEITVDSFPTYALEPTNIRAKLINSELDAFYEYSEADLPEAVMSAVLELPRESLINDLEAIIDDGIGRYEYIKKNSEPNKIHPHAANDIYFMGHAIRFLAVLNVTESLPKVLNLLRQGKEFLDFWYGDTISEDFDAPLFMLGKDRLDMFKSYLMEPHQFYWSRNVVLNVMVQIALHYPEKYEKVVAYLKEVFDYLLQNPDKEGIVDTSFISWSLSYVANLRDESFIEYLEKFDERKWVEYMISHLESLKKEYSLASEAGDLDPMPQDIYEFYDGSYKKRKVFHSSLKEIKEEYLNSKASLYIVERMSRKLADIPIEVPKNDHNDNNNYQRKQPIVQAPRKKIRPNAPCPCGSGKKFKKCCRNKTFG